MLDALNKYAEKGFSSFHTPGHKGSAEILAPLIKILDYALTELPATGSLFDGEGLTAEAERAAAELFGSKGTFFSAGGCTLAIQAMLRLAFPRGGKLACGRAVHRSAVNAMALLGIEPVWIQTDGSAGKAFSGRVPPEAVRDILKSSRDIGALYITSPDYFGVMSDVAALSDVCREYDVPLLVDNAHGSHLKWFEGGPHPLALGAAMTADSAHKTLPVLTGGAFLHINDEKYLPHARAAMALFGSTSPSYPVMLSLDLCRIWLKKEGKAAFAELAAKNAGIKEIFRSLGFSLPEGPADPVRLSACPLTGGIGGGALGAYLRENGVESEFADESHIILIPSPFNPEGDWDKLKKSLLSCPRGGPKEFFMPKHLPKAAFPPRESLLSEARIIKAADASGFVSAETVCLCPPGIPLVAAGEIIDEFVLAGLKKSKIENIKVVK